MGTSHEATEGEQLGCLTAQLDGKEVRIGISTVKGSLEIPIGVDEAIELAQVLINCARKIQANLGQTGKPARGNGAPS